MIASEFAEKVLNIKLLPHQKEFVNEAYAAAKEHKSMLYFPPRGYNKYSFVYLQALAFIMAGQDEGIIKKEINRNELVNDLSPCADCKVMSKESCCGCKAYFDWKERNDD